MQILQKCDFPPGAKSTIGLGKGIRGALYPSFVVVGLLLAGALATQTRPPGPTLEPEKGGSTF